MKELEEMAYMDSDEEEDPFATDSEPEYIPSEESDSSENDDTNDNDSSDEQESDPEHTTIEPASEEKSEAEKPQWGPYTGKQKQLQFTGNEGPQIPLNPEMT
nr:unnamed protein product [Callosobruchus chinensis]